MIPQPPFRMAMACEWLIGVGMGHFLADYYSLTSSGRCGWAPVHFGWPIKAIVREGPTPCLYPGSHRFQQKLFVLHIFQAMAVKKRKVLHGWHATPANTQYFVVMVIFLVAWKFAWLFRDNMPGDIFFQLFFWADVFAEAPATWCQATYGQSP